MATYIPAIKAHIGGTDYFSTVMTLGEASRLIGYVEELDNWTTETPSELKLQRKLNVSRVEKEMVPYLLDTPDHFYSSLTVEIRPAISSTGQRDVEFSSDTSFPGGIEFGTLTMDGTEMLYALDGQHRLKSIELALKELPELAGEHISVILIPFTGIKQSQLLFSDLNRYARNPSKSISLLFAHRDSAANVSKGLADKVSLLKDRVNMETTSLSVGTKHFITLSTLYEMTKTLLPADWPASPTDEMITQQINEQAEVWEKLTSTIEEWSRVETGDEPASYLRARFLCVHGVGQRSIANAVAGLRRDKGKRWETWLKRLGKIDWGLTNEEWQGVAIQGGRPSNTPTSIRLLTGAINLELGQPVDKEIVAILAGDTSISPVKNHQ